MIVETLSRWYPLVLLLISIVLAILLVLLWNKLRRSPDRPDNRPEEAPHHFAPGQISLLAEHRSGLIKEDIAALARLDPLYREELLEPYNAYIQADRIATFEQDEHIFSLIPVQVPALRQEDQLIELIDRLNIGIDRRDEPGKPPIDSQSNGHAQNGNAPDHRSIQPSDGEQPASDLSFKLATPSWLAGGTPEPDGSGSPGARPMPPSPDVRDKLLGSGPGLTKFGPAPDLHLSLPREEWGGGVDVYILDTAPCDIDIARAYERWRHTNPLIASLLRPGPDRPLDIHYAGATHLLEQADFYHPGHNYVMSDHGLFVAGIIHAIAPKAKLHLIEVLNPYGVGTLNSIATGFDLAARGIGPQSKRVVNASLGLEVPQPRADWLDYVRKHDPFWRQFSASRITTMVSPLERICELFDYFDLDEFGNPNRHPYVGAVAAAGNDHTPRSPLPPARYPAAHRSVLGVGALKHDDKTPAEYSNIADTPKSDGIATFGGDPHGINTDPTYGVVGAYIGTFPDGSENGYGLASWAGTSFATPRISGYIAALMSDGRTFAGAVKELRAVVHHPETTAVGEVVA